MKRSKNFFKRVEKNKGNVFWDKILIKPLVRNRIGINDKEDDINHNFQAYFTNKK